jgi:hypothetical protein
MLEDVTVTVETSAESTRGQWQGGSLGLRAQVPTLSWIQVGRASCRSW